MSKTIIEFKNVSKTYADTDTTVLKDISFELEEGKFYTLLGASGSGKSTILNIIAGLLDATDGDVILDDKRINDLPANKRNVHTIFQSYALFPNMNVFDNVAFALKIKGVDKKEIAKRVSESLKLVRLDGFEKRSITKLSGGQKQRVGIARALAMEPKLLLLDEPTSALDPELVGEVQEVILNAAKNKQTMVLVSHEMDFVYNVATKVLFLEQGKIIEAGSPKEVFYSPKNPRTREFLSRHVKNLEVNN